MEVSAPTMIPQGFCTRGLNEEAVNCHMDWAIQDCASRYNGEDKL